MLAALAGGRALPAGELARRAGVRPATASTHLRRLTEGGLIRVRAQGRHRYHEIVNPEVATVLEAIAQIAPPAPVPSLSQHRAARALFDEGFVVEDLYEGAEASLRRLKREGWIPPVPNVSKDEPRVHKELEAMMHVR